MDCQSPGPAVTGATALVSSPGDLGSKSLELLQSLVRCVDLVARGFGLVVGHHELLDSFHQLLDAGGAAPPDGPLGEYPKPALHLVETGGVGGNEIDVESWPLGQPGPDLGVIVGRVVDHD